MYNDWDISKQQQQKKMNKAQGLRNNFITQCYYYCSLCPYVRPTHSSTGEEMAVLERISPPPPVMFNFI